MKWTRKKHLSSDTEVGKLLDRWRIRNFLEPLVLCSSTHWFQYQIGAYPIISKKINIPGSHIIMLYDVSSNAQDDIFDCKVYSFSSFFHCFILTWYYIVRTVKQDLTRVITLLDFEGFLLIIATTAWLSTLKIICLFFKCIPQMCTEMTTGNNSKT